MLTGDALSQPSRERLAFARELEAVHDLMHEHTAYLVLRTRGAVLDVVEREVDLLVYLGSERVRHAVHWAEDEEDLLDATCTHILQAQVSIDFE